MILKHLPENVVPLSKKAATEKCPLCPSSTGKDCPFKSLVAELQETLLTSLEKD